MIRQACLTDVNIKYGTLKDDSKIDHNALVDVDRVVRVSANSKATASEPWPGAD